METARLSEPWTQPESIEPQLKGTEPVPPELKLWRRWSNSKEEIVRKDSIVMSQNCKCCGISDLEVRCKSCGTTSMILDVAIDKQPFNFPLPTPPSNPESPSSSSGGESLATPDMDEEIQERDFAARSGSKRPVPMYNRPSTPLWNPTEGGSSSTWKPSTEAGSSSNAAPPPLPTLDVSSESSWQSSAGSSASISPSTSQAPYKPYASQPLPTAYPVPREGAKRRSHIASFRQSMIEASQPTRPKRWFEKDHGERSLKFKFVLTPRLQAARNALPPADEEGRIIEPAASKEADESGGSSRPASSNPSLPSMSLAEIAGDPSGLQRLLACTMFLMDKIPEEEGKSKTLDLGVVSKGQSGMRGFSMKHENKLDFEQQKLADEMKRVMWKVSLS